MTVALQTVATQALAFDHAIVVVPSVAEGIRRFAEQGLVATPGGEHAGRGTANAIVQFGATYIELVTVTDADLARASQGERGSRLVEFVERVGFGYSGFTLRSDDVEALAARPDSPGLGAETRVVRRRLPSGELLEWRVLWPGGPRWRPSVPSFLQPSTSNPRPVAPSHPLGVTDVAGVGVLVADLDDAADWYGRRAGFTGGEETSEAALGATRARYRLDGFAVDVFAPTGSGAIADEVARVGTGVWRLTLAVADLAAARATLARLGHGEPPPDLIDGGVVHPGLAALGLPTALVQR